MARHAPAHRITPVPRALGADAFDDPFRWFGVVWPFGQPTIAPRPGEDPPPFGGLPLLTRVPASVIDEFPLFPYRRPDMLRDLRERVWGARQQIESGRNAAFEGLVADLVRVLHAERAELIARSTADLAVWEWARDYAGQFTKLEARRNAAMARLTFYRGALRALSWLSPEARAEITPAIQYLEAIPFKRELRDWRRQFGVTQRTASALPVWTECGRLLRDYLVPRFRERYKAYRAGALPLEDRQWLDDHAPVERAAALLTARYPELPRAFARRLAHRLRRR